MHNIFFLVICLMIITGIIIRVFEKNHKVDVKKSLKFVAIAMTLWLVVLAVFGGIYLFYNGIETTGFYNLAVTLTLIVLVGVSAVASQFVTKQKYIEQI